MSSESDREDDGRTPAQREFLEAASESTTDTTMLRAADVYADAKHDDAAKFVDVRRAYDAFLVHGDEHTFNNDVYRILHDVKETPHRPPDPPLVPAGSEAASQSSGESSSISAAQILGVAELVREMTIAGIPEWMARNAAVLVTSRKS